MFYPPLELSRCHDPLFQVGIKCLYLYNFNQNMLISQICRRNDFKFLCKCKGFDIICTDMYNFDPHEVVGRGSDKQFQVGNDLNLIIQRFIIQRFISILLNNLYLPNKMFQNDTTVIPRC